MNTVTEYIRNHLMERLGCYQTKKCPLSLDEILEQEMNWEFLAEMAHGMIMGFFRYGPAKESKINNLKEVKRRIKIYEQTKNLECLRDIANFIMQERKNPSINGTYFKILDDSEHAEEYYEVIP